MNKKLNWDNVKFSILGLDINIDSSNFIQKDNSLQHKLLLKINDELSIVLEKAIYLNASPPIKGNLTVGKLKYRGIRLCENHPNHNILQKVLWIEQKKKRISPIITIEFDNTSYTYSIKKQ